MANRKAVLLGGLAALVTVSVVVAGAYSVDPQISPPIQSMENNNPESVTISSTDVSQRPETCEGYVSLTFDDGPTQYTPVLLDLLDEYDVPAVFFNTGLQTSKFPEYVRDMVRRGHQVGNHTWDHPNLTKVSDSTLRRQIEKTSQIHETLADPFQFFRPPFGATNPVVQEEVRKQGMIEVLWTADSKDFEAKTPADVVENTIGMEDGGIALLHDGKPLTIKALPEIIDHYHDREFCFGKIVKTTEPTIPPWSKWMGYYAKAVAPSEESDE